MRRVVSILSVFVILLSLAGCKAIGDINSDSSDLVQPSSSSMEQSSEDDSSAEGQEQSSQNVASETSSEMQSAEEPSSEETSSQESSSAENGSVSYRFPYCIKINRALNTATVYEKDEDGEFTVPLKAIVVSCGTDTPLGTFHISSQYRWKLMDGDVYAQYASRVVGHILIHSVPYYTASSDDLCYREYNKLGTTASHGCIRMTAVDSKWVFQNCKSGTTVVIYDDSDSAGPLGKPTAPKVPTTGKYRGWDPTDPDKDNPWHNVGDPVLKGVQDKTIELGDQFDPLDGVTAVDGLDFDITEKIKVKSKVVLDQEGTYAVKYSVTDSQNKTVEQLVKITVKDTLPPDIRISSTDLFTVSSEEEGFAEIQKRISVTDRSGNCESDVQITVLSQKDKTEVTTTVRELLAEQSSQEESSLPEEDGDTSSAPQTQTVTTTHVMWLYTCQATITASDAKGNTSAKEAVLQFIVDGGITETVE